MAIVASGVLVALWIVAAPHPALVGATVSSAAGVESSGGATQPRSKHRSLPDRAGTDPAVAAREVLQDQDFWWKRIEPRTIPTSGSRLFSWRCSNFH